MKTPSLLSKDFLYTPVEKQGPDYLREKFKAIKEKQEREKVEHRLNRVIKIKRSA
jgi:hypothetical protein